MYCRNCGAPINGQSSVCMSCGVRVGDGNRFCPNCGAQPDPMAVMCVRCGADLRYRQNTLANEYDGTFIGAIKSAFLKIIDFEGRATKSEFWYFWLFTFLVSLVSYGIGSIVLLLPMIAVGVRRLHDTGKSGLYYLLALIPLVGSIVMIVLWCGDSEPHDNQYGPYPKQF